ncbi:MAG: ECF transporter S component [Anaerovoracaceae bacterium]|nr:ECF transporter S component [Anaerovoracaceae bacterium]
MRQGFNVTQYEAACRKRTRVSSLIIFILIPATIAAGCIFLDNERYMVVSLALLVYTMVPFFMVFEKRKPKAREIVLIAMMAAITVCAQLFFHMVLPLQIGTALIIISGIALGPEAGFLIGATARFICNFYMGQGPWTPWQMFCWGLLGFLAGLAFNRIEPDKLKSRNFKVILGPVMCVAFAVIAAYICYIIWPGEDNTFFGWRLYVFGAAGLLAGVLLQRKRLPADNITLTVFTFFITFIIYGGLMNICAMVTSAALPGGAPVSMGTLKTLLITGAPYDATHAATAALCVFVFGDAMIKKLERIKIKYGIYR